MANKHPRTEQDYDWTPRRKMTHTFKEQHLLTPQLPEGTVAPPVTHRYSERVTEERHGRSKGGKNHPEKLSEYQRLKSKQYRLQRSAKTGRDVKVGWTPADTLRLEILEAEHKAKDGRRARTSAPSPAPPPIKSPREMEKREATVTSLLMYPMPAVDSFKASEINYFTQLQIAADAALKPPAPQCARRAPAAPQPPRRAPPPPLPSPTPPTPPASLAPPEPPAPPARFASARPAASRPAARPPGIATVLTDTVNPVMCPALLVGLNRA